MRQFATLKQAIVNCALFASCESAKRGAIRSLYAMISKKKSQGGILNEEKKKENRKDVAEFFAHAGDARRADAGDEFDGFGY